MRSLHLYAIPLLAASLAACNGGMMTSESDSTSGTTGHPKGVAYSHRAIVLHSMASALPDTLDPRLRAPDLCDRNLGVSLPDATTRRQLLEVMLRGVPCDELDLTAIAERTPGFVAADIAALIREAALRAAARASSDGGVPRLCQDDLTGALTVIRPLSRSATEEVAVGSVTLDDVGDMVATKQALTEAVLWPLQHPETFQRLGVQPPRGVLLGSYAAAPAS